MPNRTLLFITIDQLPATAFPCYGNRETESPCLDTLALQGVVFDEHYAPATSPQASLLAWTAGKTAMLPTEIEAGQTGCLSPEDFVEQLTSQNIIASLITCSLPSTTEPDNTNIAEFEKQTAQFFDELSQSNRQDPHQENTKTPANAFCWIRLAASSNDQAETLSQIDQVLLSVQEHASKYQSELNKSDNSSLAWIITSEQNDSPDENITECEPDQYTKQLNQSLSRKLRRPLIVSGNFLPENCPQRIDSFTIAQDIHLTILDYLQIDTEPSSDASFRSLLTDIFDDQQTPVDSPQGLNRQLLLLDTDQAGLRTQTDLTVLTIPCNTTEEFNSQSPRYYLKPEDRHDINDMNSTVPDLVDERVAALKFRLSKCD